MTAGNSWKMVLALTVLLPVSPTVFAGDTGTTHKKTQTSDERPSSDRMTRHERKVVQARSAASRRALEKRFNMRAFNRDFDRISSRFEGTGGGGVSDPRSDSRTSRADSSNGHSIPVGTKLRDPDTGQVFIVQ